MKLFSASLLVNRFLNIQRELLHVTASFWKLGGGGAYSKLASLRTLGKLLKIKTGQAFQ
jgi:hypothetical protein